MAAALQVVVILAFPAIALWSERRYRWAKALSAVILCYAGGILLCNVGAPLSRDISQSLTEGTVLLSIPLLLFGTDVWGFLELAPRAIGAYGLAVLAVIITSAAGAAIFAPSVEHPSEVAGMLVGVYTGGAPNLTAIGVALEVGESTIISVNSADMLIGALYFFLLLSLGPRGARRLLHHEAPEQGEDGAALVDPEEDAGPEPAWRYVVALLLGLATVGLAVGVALIATGRLAPTPIIVAVTTLGIGASFVRSIRTLKAAYGAGQYLMLVFCFALGSMARFDELIRAFTSVLPYVAFVMFGAVAVHVALCKLFRIDADSTVMASTAAVFGPPFVAPVSRVLARRDLIVVGVTSGVIGLAIGNYLGLLVAWLVASSQGS